MKSLANRISVAQQKVTSARSTGTIDIDRIHEEIDSRVQVRASRVLAMSADFTITGPGTRVPMGFRLVNGALYLSGRQVLASLHITGKKWVLLSVASKNQGLAQLARSFTTATHLTGGEQAATLTAAATHVRDLGTADLDGVPTHRYSMAVDLARATAAMSGTGTGDTKVPVGATVPIDLWLDSGDRVVRVVEEFTQSNQHLRIDIRTGSFDQPVAVAAPDPADVATG